MISQRKPQKIAYIIFILGALFYCYEYFLRIAPAVMSHPLMQTFHIDATLFGTLSAFYFYAYTPMQLFVGVIVDRFSVRKVLILAIISCTVGSFMLSYTDSYTVAAVGRFLQGFGSAFAFVGALKLVSIWLPYDRFAFYAGLVSMLGFLGACLGTISLNNFVQTIGWRSTIHYFAIFGVAIVIAVWITTRHTPKQDTKKIKSQAATFKQSLAQLRQIMAIPKIWLAAIYAGLMFLPTSVFAALWGVPYLEKLHGYNPTHASTAVSMIFFGWAIGAALSGWLSDILGYRTPIMRAGSLLALLLALPLLYMGSLPFILVCVLFVLFGVFSSVECLSFVIAKDLCPNNKCVGTAVALVNTFTMIGGMVFQRGLGEIMDWSWSGSMAHGIRVYTLYDYEKAITIVPVSLFLAFILSIFIKDSL
tara:strand:+ start:1241 stop:2497 length:1257 start_codon:yes stop_codon:yes gene_type:complete